jgi:hypothetical protein
MEDTHKDRGHERTREINESEFVKIALRIKYLSSNSAHLQCHPYAIANQPI